jgi:hypothetical protein
MLRPDLTQPIIGYPFKIAIAFFLDSNSRPFDRAPQPIENKTLK